MLTQEMLRNYLRIRVGRLFTTVLIVSSCFGLFAASAVGARPAKAAPSACQSFNNFTSSTGSLNITGGQPWLAPGEALIFTVKPNSVTQVDVAGSYFTTYTQTLPFSFSYASIPAGKTLSVIANPFGITSLFTYTTTCISTSSAVSINCPIFFDGRLNNCDAGQTAAIYCEKDGSVTVLAIFNSKGYAAFVVTPTEIAQVPKKPSQNTLIKSGNGAQLYRLKSGELQVNRAEDGTGKLYHFIFTDCSTP